MSAITLTESAKNYLTKIAKTNNRQYVVFGVNGGGCSGFTYMWDFADTCDPEYEQVPCDDDVVLLIDPTSMLYVLGSEIDYVSEIGGSFLKVNNPLAASSCGCGESFNVRY